MKKFSLAFNRFLHKLVRKLVCENLEEDGRFWKHARTTVSKFPPKTIILSAAQFIEQPETTAFFRETFCIMCMFFSKIQREKTYKIQL